MTWYRQKYICRYHIRARYNYVLKAKDLSGPVSNNSTGTHPCVSQCVCVCVCLSRDWNGLHSSQDVS